MAEELPGGTFIGIDLSPRQIEEGSRTVEAVGLDHVRLLPMSILDVTPEFGQFDYILCHGVYSWVPAAVLESLGVERNNQWRFRQADGTILERWTGTVVVAVGGRRVGDEVVFGEPGDLALLGSRTLEGLNFRVEPVTKRLVDAGPAPAAAAA